MDGPNIDVSPIPKHGINYSKSCEVFIEDVRVPEENLLGEEDDGWWTSGRYANPDVRLCRRRDRYRRAAADTAIEYASDREVFDVVARAIGGHEADTRQPDALVQHLLGEGVDGSSTGRRCRRSQTPAKATALAVAMNVKGVVRTRSPGPTPSAWSAAWSAVVPLEVATPWSQQMAYNHIGQNVRFPERLPQMFSKVLVANRGEIAVRVMRACEELGVETVAVYSEADSNAGHVEYADDAYNVGPAPAASRTSTRPLSSMSLSGPGPTHHRGYGFLAETLVRWPRRSR